MQTNDRVQPYVKEDRIGHSSIKSTLAGKMKLLIGRFGLVIVVLISVVILSILSPVFLTKSNITNLFMQSAVLATLALGSTFVIIVGGIDLSVGAVMSTASTIGLGAILQNHVSIFGGILIMLLIGIAFGCFNGFFITRFGISPLIVTLSSMGIGRGIVSIFSNGVSIKAVQYTFNLLTYGKILGIPITLVVVVILSIIAGITLAYSVYGRVLYATGGSEVAAKLAGIRTNMVIFMAYVISGLSASIGGLLLTARTESAGPNTGLGIEMTVISAVVIGGTSLFGGQGNIFGTILGVIVISLSTNAVSLLEVPPNWDQLIKGAVILIAALLDVYRRQYANNLYKPVKRNKS